MKKPGNKTLLVLTFPVIFFMAGLNAESYSLENLLETSVIQELTEKGEIKHTLEKGETNFLLTPKTEYCQNTTVFNGGDEKEEPSFVAESLYLVKKTDLISSSKKSNPDVSVDEVSRIVRSISKMKGMEYYSNSQQAWDILYSESYLISDPISKERIPDFLEGSADGLELYCFQNEHAFGESIYSILYHQNEKEVSVTFQNIEALKYKFITAVKKGNMNINLVVMDCGDSFLVYMVIQADVIRVSIIEKRMNKSLNARLDAIYKWFTEQF